MNQSAELNERFPDLCFAICRFSILSLDLSPRATSRTISFSSSSSFGIIGRFCKPNRFDFRKGPRQGFDRQGHAQSLFLFPVVLVLIFYSFLPVSMHSPHSTGGLDQCSTRDAAVVENIHSPAVPPENLEESYSFLPRLKIPPDNDTKAWADANETIDLCLQQSHPSFNKLPADKMLTVLTEAIRFYFPTKSEGKPSADSKAANHASQLKHLRTPKRQLRREWRNRQNEPIENTAALRSEFHAVHNRIKRLSAQLASEEKKG